MKLISRMFVLWMECVSLCCMSPLAGFGFGAPQGSAPVNNAGFFGAKPANPASGFGNPSNANPASGFGNPLNANPASGFGNPSNAAAASAAGAFTFTGQQPSAPAAAFGSQVRCFIV